MSETTENNTTAEAKKAINLSDLRYVKKYIDDQISAALKKITDGTVVAGKASEATSATNAINATLAQSAGTATEAFKATNDSDGNKISETYYKKTDTDINVATINKVKIEQTGTFDGRKDSLDNVDHIDAKDRLHVKYTKTYYQAAEGSTDLVPHEATIDAIAPMRKLVWSGSQCSYNDSTSSYVSFNNMFKPRANKTADQIPSLYYDIEFTSVDSSDATLYRARIEIPEKGSYIECPFYHESGIYGGTNIPTFIAKILRIRRTNDGVIEMYTNQVTLKGTGDSTVNGEESSCASTSISVKKEQPIYLKTVYAILQ